MYDTADLRAAEADVRTARSRVANAARTGDADRVDAARRELSYRKARAAVLSALSGPDAPTQAQRDELIKLLAGP